MKKFLSMVLALVMAMSLVTISAGAADFADKDSIDYLEAVEVMTALGVVDGYADGSFGPDGYLTRGAAAKIICNLILGPTTASALVADAAPYSDVPTSNVFAGYIAFCQKEGIINGYADGTFKPGNSLTGYAFMKMLLCALGYDADIEGYTGANWSINVAKQAINLGLEKGLEGDFNGVNTVTRQEALLYAFNAIQKNTINYGTSSSIVVGDIKVTTTGTAQTGATFVSKYFPKLTSAPAEDVYGRPGTEWKNGTKVIGTYTKKADATYVGNAKIYNIRKDLGLATSETPTFYTTVQSVYSWVYGYGAAKLYNNVETTLPTANSASTSTLNSTVFSAYNNGFYPCYNGVAVEVFYDKTNVANNKIVVIDEMFAEIKEVKKDDDGRYVTLQGDGVNSAWKFYTNDFAKGDKVVYTLGVNATNGIASVKAAKSVEGTLTYINGSTYCVIDGVGYYVHGTKWFNNGAYTYYTATPGTAVVAYLDSTGNIIGLENVKETYDVSSLLTVLAGESASGLLGTNKGRVVYGDGKVEVLETYANYDADKGGIYAFTTTNGKLKIKAATGFNALQTADAANYYKNDTVISNGVDTIEIDAQTAFVFVKTSDNTTKTYTGYKALPAFTGGDVIALTKTNDKAATLVYVFDATLTNAASAEYTMLVSGTYYKWQTTKADGTARAYYAVNDIFGGYVYVDAAYYDTATTGLGAQLAGTNTVVIVDSITRDVDTADVIASANLDVNVLDTANSDTVILYKNGVLYVGSTSYKLAETVEVFAIGAGTSKTAVEDDVTALNATYAGYTLIGNDKNEVTTIVLKEKA